MTGCARLKLRADLAGMAEKMAVKYILLRSPAAKQGAERAPDENQRPSWDF